MMQSTDDNIEELAHQLRGVNRSDMEQNKSIMASKFICDELIDQGVPVEWARKIACTPMVSIGDDADPEKLGDMIHHLVYSQILAAQMITSYESNDEFLWEAIDRTFQHVNLTM